MNHYYTSLTVQYEPRVNQPTRFIKNVRSLFASVWILKQHFDCFA
ncbi:hypothetical protein NBRC111894_4627 [Sporolactobacillus inulinus]|uniref:Uncharacterized protein n=1 Tax=Sporolactobacillus inulinus TaxID=2078 RepID=A0A4Y1ZJF1_9BACL|nr:hypothetical protein NBRC111894_4627 [Sporolactobacillus inulinus]